MPPEMPPKSNGTGGAGFTLSGLHAEVLGPAPSEAVAVIYSQMAHAVGLAMQNIVAQQQTLNTINNAIATKALNLLADTDPQAALAEIRKQFSATTSDTVGGLSTLAGLMPGRAPPAQAGQGGETQGGEASPPQEPPAAGDGPPGGGHAG
jgi:hypothetical protein